MIDKWLFKYIDNSSLIVFRIIFGLLCVFESVGAIFTGWVKRTLVEPEFTFSFIGLEWLQPLPGYGMYAYYLVMGLFAAMVMLGYKYRVSIIAFTLMWSGTYFMQKASYNNHYYLLMLLSAIMAFLPANTYAAFDARHKNGVQRIAMPQWCKWVFVVQLFIMYTYAAIAKLYPDWLDTTFIARLMQGKRHYILIGELLQQKWLHYFLVYGGIVFDGLIIPLLLYKPTRKWAFIASICFHVFNSIVFQVGIFPYLALAFTLFFFEPKTIHKLFLKRKPFYEGEDIIPVRHKRFFKLFFLVYFIFQVLLPLRHHVIADHVLWTEEGHRMSWRMMLRSKSGRATYTVENKHTGERFIINTRDYLTRKQQRLVSTKPDVIWQFAQYLKQVYKAQQQDVAVYVNCKVSINGRPYKTLINPDVDLAGVPWDIFKHSSWILPSKLD